MNKNKFIINQYFILFNLYLFSCFIILSVTLDLKTKLYSGFFISLVYLIYNLFIILKRGKITIQRDSGNFSILICIYIIYSIIVTLFKPHQFIYTIQNVLPFLTILVIDYNLHEPNLCRRLFINIKRCLIIYILVFVILYFIGYSGIVFTSSGFKIIPQSEMLARFNELRINGFTSHKSSFSLLCYTALLYLRLDKKNTKNQFLGYSLILIAIGLSGSITSLAICLITYLNYFIIDFHNKNRYLKLSVYIYSFPLLVIFMNYFFKFINSSRNLLTGGSRFYIWKMYFQLAIHNKIGLVRLTEDFLIKDAKYDLYYHNAHNVFIQEFVERGFIGGVLLCCIVIFFLVKFLKFRRYDLSVGIIGIISICFMDYAISEESVFTIWYLIILAYTYARNLFIEGVNEDEKSRDICNCPHI